VAPAAPDADAAPAAQQQRSLGQMVDKVMAAQRAGQTLQVARKDAVARNQLGIAKQAALTMDTNEVVYQGAMDEYVCCGVAPDSALRVRLLRLVRPISPLHLPYISHIYPLYLPCISPVSPLRLLRLVLHRD